MPGYRTHDLLTLLLVVPCAFAVFFLFGSHLVWVVFSIGFLAGGWFLGPDLDTCSEQYRRWGLFRVVWFPYRMFFRHRSRFTHGFLFGTIFRLIYLSGVFSFLAILAAFIVGSLGGPGLSGQALEGSWRHTGTFFAQTVGFRSIAAFLGGVWAGSVVHTMTDICGTYIKTGKLPSIW